MCLVVVRKTGSRIRVQSGSGERKLEHHPVTGAGALRQLGMANNDEGGTMARKRKNDVEKYVAVGSLKARASAAQIQSAYKIEVRFLGGLTAPQKNAFKKAADRWSKVIVGDVPSVLVSGEVIDDLVIEAQGTAIDGPGGILGQAGPTNLRPASAGASAFLPAKGIMSFDTADLAQMAADGTLVDVITHEMGHVIGIGTIWEQKRLLTGASTANPRLKGTQAKKAFGELKGVGPDNGPRREHRRRGHP